jgi:transposase
MMGLSFPASIFLSARACDMRKSIDGLCGEVRNYLGCDPMDKALFVFYNRRRDKIKLLLWETDGYWVFYKRLEIGKFQQPLISTEATHVSLDGSQLRLILSGIDLSTVKRLKRYHANC